LSRPFFFANVQESEGANRVTCCLRKGWKLAIACGVCVLGMGGGAGLMPVAAQQQTAAVESDNPLSGDPDAIVAGRRLFNTWCTQCHGGKANGEARFGKYAADLTKFSLGYTEFATIVVAGRPDRMMPPWDGVLDGEQISQIGAYLETLAVPGANWKDP
jgi:mono/diheme cytochrome c family protein